MEEIKEFFENIRRIRVAVESLVPEKAEADCCEKKAVNETIVPKKIAQTQTVQVITEAMPNSIPLAHQVESFTQEQIAVAMSNAMAAGRNDIVQNILATFNATCLMQIDSSNYNKIATMLREAGIQV